ncbi:S-layer homology domain-containing protein [Paenibacillus sp. y28]|uniref:S-layer homology domain-containing protein n=1 Tax=Paenibacillus sp. y28 TaxID=3129110 RepID=UPI0030197AAE
MKRFLKQVAIGGISSVLLLSASAPAWAMETVDATRAIAATSIAVDSAVGQTEAPADAKISKDQAVSLAKQLVKIPDGYELRNISYNKAYYELSGGRGAWSMYFEKKVTERAINTISVSIDAENGRLTGYYFSENDPDKKPSYPPKYDLSQAKTVADSFIGDLNSGEAGQIQYDDSFEKAFRTPLNGYVQYSFNYYRVVNGAVFTSNAISVQVDGEGHVVGYNFRWDDKLEFEAADGAISKEAAVAAFRDQLKPQLKYLVPYNTKTKQIALSYQMNTLQLDAKTGKSWNSAPVVQGGEPLASQPLAAKPSANQNLTKEQALELITKNFTIPASNKLQDASYYENTAADGTVDASWNLSWNSTDEENPSSAYAAVNSHTGEVRSFSRNEHNIYYSAKDAEKQASEYKVSYDEGKNTAVALVKQLLPHYAHELVLQPQTDLGQQKLAYVSGWSYIFSRQVNGVETENDRVTVNVDRKTGEVTSYWSSISDYDYPASLPQTIGDSKALDLLLGTYNVEQRYVLESQQYYGGIPIEKYRLMVASGEIAPTEEAPAATATPKAKLVYQLVPKYTSNEGYYLDAEHGTWQSRETGAPVSLEKVVVTDIVGHAAQNELQLMVDYKALDVKDGKVNPEQQMTRGEMIKMLVISLNGGGPIYPMFAAGAAKSSFRDVATDNAYFSYVEFAAQNNLIDRNSAVFNPEALMTREDMAELLVRALGYHKLASVDKLFAISFNDADKLKQKGDAAITVGLGLLNVDADGNFGPEQSITRAQAATTFYHFLQVRSELLENSLTNYYRY